MEFPNDDNGQILAEMHQAGVDLSQLHVVDFFILFEQKGDAEQFQSAMKEDQLATEIKIQKCADTGVWEALTSIQMVPQHELITTTENYLETIANPLNGYGDGWGIMAE